MEIKFTNVVYKDVLKDISFKITDGIVGFISSNEDEMTTIMELICTLKFANRGWVEFNNHIVSNKFKGFFEIKKKFGYVPKNPRDYFFHKTVFEELSFSLENNDDIEKRIGDSLKLVGLNDSYLDRNPNNLSLGEQKKLSLAIALSKNPEILILDEPLENMDSKFRTYLIKLLKLMKRRYNKTIIIASKDVDLLFEICDNVNVINNGKVVKSADKYTVFSNYNLLKRSGLATPKTSSFSQLVQKKKGIKLGCRNDINDLIKDIYRYAR